MRFVALQIVLIPARDCELVHIVKAGLNDLRHTLARALKFLFAESG